VAGHEAAGIVEEVGENVTIAKPGKHVVVSLLRACGRCFYCTTGAPYMCEGEFALDTESRLRTKRGEPIRHGSRTAAFAEYVIVEQSQVVPVPYEIPLDRAALLACGVITGVGAVLNTASPQAGSKVSFPVSQFVGGERKVMGSSMGSSRLSVDVPRLVELYKRGRLKLDELITARYPLEQINEAVEIMEKGEALRNVIIF
jgi:Zn-dependent alcohol dehydrogenase